MHHHLELSSHAHSTARNSQLVHSRATVMHGRVSLNSSNSRGDTEARGQRFCVQGRTKSLSTSTRTGVRRCAVYESAHTQQAPLKLHEETWEGLLCNQGIFKEVEIVPGCVVKVACPSCPDYSPESPGPDRVIRNIIGWSLQEQTGRSGVWLFLGCPPRRESFFLSLTQQETGKRRVVPHSVGAPLRFLMHLFICLWTWSRCRATHWKAVLHIFDFLMFFHYIFIFPKKKFLLFFFLVFLSNICSCWR